MYNVYVCIWECSYRLRPSTLPVNVFHKLIKIKNQNPLNVQLRIVCCVKVLQCYSTRSATICGAS